MRGEPAARGGDDPTAAPCQAPSGYDPAKENETPHDNATQGPPPDGWDGSQEVLPAQIRVRCETCGREDSEGLPTLEDDLSDLTRDMRVFDALMGD